MLALLSFCCDGTARAPSGCSGSCRTIVFVPLQVQLFTIGLQMNPRHALLQFSMGSIFAVQGKKEEAINSFETTLRIQPDFKPAEQCVCFPSLPSPPLALLPALLAPIISKATEAPSQPQVARPRAFFRYLLQLRQEMGRKWRTLSRDVWVLLGVFAVTVILVQRAVHRAFMRPDQVGKRISALQHVSLQWQNGVLWSCDVMSFSNVAGARTLQ